MGTTELWTIMELACNFSGGEEEHYAPLTENNDNPEIRRTKWQIFSCHQQDTAPENALMENPGMESRPANSQGIKSRTPRVEGSGGAFGAHQPGHFQAVEHVFITCQDLQNSKLLGI